MGFIRKLHFVALSKDWFLSIVPRLIIVEQLVQKMSNLLLVLIHLKKCNFLPITLNLTANPTCERRFGEQRRVLAPVNGVGFLRFLLLCPLFVLLAVIAVFQISKYPLKICQEKNDNETKSVMACLTCHGMDHLS